MTSSNKKTRQNVKNGDVIAIPLPSGKFAFGLQMGDATAIYSILGDDPFKPPIGHRKFMFAVGVYKDVLSNTDWPKVSKETVTPVEIEFAGISYLKDAITGEYSLYSEDENYLNGIPSSQQECYGLEAVSAWDKQHIVDRIIDTLRLKKSIWLMLDDWIPFGLDMSSKAADGFKRVSINEILA